MTCGKGISWPLTGDLEVSIGHPGIIKTWRRRRKVGQEEQNPSPFRVASAPPWHSPAGKGQVPAPYLQPGSGCSSLARSALCPSLPFTFISQFISVILQKWDIKYSRIIFFFLFNIAKLSRHNQQ